MNKEIKYSGFSAVPSDYESPDGDLALSLNLINRNGNMVPAPAPKTLRSLPFPAVAIHNVPGNAANIILYDSASKAVLSLPLNDSDADPAFILSFPNKPKVAILGNTLLFSDGVSVAYALWIPDSSAYRSLGAAPPEISIDLALGYDAIGHGYLSSVSDTLSVPVPDGADPGAIMSVIGSASRRAPGRAVARPSSGVDAFRYSLSDAVFGFLNSTAANAADNSYFIFPFFIRWAIRLFDGSYIHQSAPILMIPNSGLIPMDYSSSVSGSVVSLKVTQKLCKAFIFFRISDIGNLLQWKDLVESVDFFVSPPVYTYDQDGLAGFAGRDFLSRHFFSHAGPAVPSGSISETRADINGDNHRQPAPSYESPLFDFSSGNSESASSASLPSIDPASFSQMEVEDKIKAVSQFYLVASIPFDDVCSKFAGLSGFAKLDIESHTLSSLQARPTLPDDFRSHDSVAFSFPFSYNSRLVLAGISSSIFPGFPLSDLSQFRTGESSVKVAVWVKVVRNARSSWVSSDSFIVGSDIPRYIFYPDNAAVEMRIVLPDGSGWVIPLKSHDFLNGSFWFDGLGSDRTPKLSSVQVPVSSGSSVAEPSKLFLSEVNNPFFFPTENRITVGSGSLIGVSSAAKALSQGQFGQFPLYAFSDEGIWALEVSASGSFSARQPLSRDVCTNPDSITQLDSAVAFASDRGIMLLSGSQVSEISSPINSDSNSPFISLPFADILASHIGLPDPALISIDPFRDFIADCGLIYDYAHQSLFIFSPSHRYAYVFSIDSKRWGMTLSNVRYPLNSYPRALAVDLNDNLLDFSSSISYFPSQLLLSRPIKLDAPDILKSVSCVVQRGVFLKGNVKSILFASRDLFSWHLVWSSPDHFLRGFAGSPYKYFVIALLGSLAPDESLSGASVVFSPHFVNRLR